MITPAPKSPKGDFRELLQIISSIDAEWGSERLLFPQAVGKLHFESSKVPFRGFRGKTITGFSLTFFGDIFYTGLGILILIN